MSLFCYKIADALAQIDSMKLHTNTPHVGICMWVWLVDVGHMVVLEDTLFLFCPHTFQQLIPTLKKN